MKIMQQFPRKNVGMCASPESEKTRMNTSRNKNGTAC